MNKIVANQNVNYSLKASPQFKAQDVTAAPAGYMPDAQVKSAANGMVGMMALGAIGVAGIALAAISRGKVKNLKADCEKIKAEKKLIQKKLDEALAGNKTGEEIKEGGKKVTNWFKKIGNKIKNIFKPGKKEVSGENAEEVLKDGVKFTKFKDELKASKKKLSDCFKKVKEASKNSEAYEKLKSDFEAAKKEFEELLKKIKPET